MNDRELLEFAAKAAGYTLGYEVNQFSRWDGVGLLRRNCNGTSTIWAPLTDDGDALRLAVKLEIVPRQINGVSFAWAKDVTETIEPHAGDPYAATRRAIVRAAALLYSFDALVDKLK